MNFEKHKIKITLNNLEYSFYYSYNDHTTFLDLLEYFAYLIPSLKLCECYQFQSVKDKKNSDGDCIIITHNCKIADFSEKLKDLMIKKITNRCNHSDFLLHSKKDIINAYKKELGKKIKEIEELKKSINDTVILSKPSENHDFYDVIVHIDSIKDVIDKGWKIEINEKGKKMYEQFKNEGNIIKIGIIGNANKGKSFILSRISKMDLPSGTSIKTEGLSVKYPDNEKCKNKNIALLDSAGLETPVLVSKDKSDEEKAELFKEKCREKLITELFLQNYIINNSDILIVVVDCLSFSEQKLLMKIKREIEKAKRALNLYVIHNLKTYTKKEQIKDYIENTLLKSATFSLKEGTEYGQKQNTGIRFFENKKNEKNNEVIHLIYANENSEAGKYYNQYTLDFIEKLYQTINVNKPYDVIETIKDRYIEVSKDIIEKREKDEKITKQSFDNSDPNLIKLKNGKEIVLKKCLIDELGFSNLKPNGFEPKYNIYIKKDEKQKNEKQKDEEKEDEKIIVRIEAPGNCILSAFPPETNLIKISGTKNKDKEPKKMEDIIHNMREFGEFNLEIPLNEYNLKTEQPAINEKMGIFIIEYKIKKPQGPTKKQPIDEV